MGIRISCVNRKIVLRTQADIGTLSAIRLLPRSMPLHVSLSQVRNAQRTELAVIDIRFHQDIVGAKG